MKCPHCGAEISSYTKYHCEYRKNHKTEYNDYMRGYRKEHRDKINSRRRENRKKEKADEYKK